MRWQVPASTALTKLRRRLGEAPFELLFWRLAGPLSPGVSPWSHICGLRGCNSFMIVMKMISKDRCGNDHFSGGAGQVA